MNEKTYTVAGYSTLFGERKLRVANSMGRRAVLMRCGHKDVELQELPYPMTREQAEEFLLKGFVAEPVKPKLTFEQALAQVPKRNSKGHFMKREEREALARQLMAA